MAEKTLYLATKDNKPLVTKAFGYVRVVYSSYEHNNAPVFVYTLYHKNSRICEFYTGNTSYGAIMIRRTHRRMSPQDNIIIGGFIRCLNTGSFFRLTQSGYTPFKPTEGLFFPLPAPIIIKTTQLWLAKPIKECVLALVNGRTPKESILDTPEYLIKKMENQKARRDAYKK